MRRLSTTILGLAALGLSSTGSVHAAGTPVIVAGPGGTVVGYTQPIAVAQPGDAIDLVVADTAPHDVVSVELGPDSAAHCKEDTSPAPGVQRRYDLGKCPIFWSELITAGKITPVRGLESVQSGVTYNYFCSIHANMKGQLVVL